MLVDYIEVSRTAILTPGPLVTLLSFSVALSLYLRGLYSESLDKIEEILTDDDHAVYKRDQQFTLAMREHLSEVADTVERVSPKLFGFIWVVCFRVAEAAMETAFPELSPHIGQVLDAAILVLLVVGLVMMQASHRRLVREHREIRNAIQVHHKNRQSMLPGASPGASADD